MKHAPISPAPPTLLSPAEAAYRFGISTKTVRNYIARGLLPAVRLGPRLIRIDPADLEKLTHGISTVGGAA